MRERSKREKTIEWRREMRERAKEEGDEGEAQPIVQKH